VTEENCTMSFMNCIARHILFGWPMKQGEMGWACDMYGGEMHTKWENVKGRGHLEDLRVDWRMMMMMMMMIIIIIIIIITWIFKNWDESLKWIHQDCDRRWAAVKAVMNILFPWNASNLTGSGTDTFTNIECSTGYLVMKQYLACLGMPLPSFLVCGPLHTTAASAYPKRNPHCSLNSMWKGHHQSSSDHQRP